MERVFGWERGLRAPCCPRVWGVVGFFSSPLGTETPELQPSGAWQEHPSGELLLALPALSLMPPQPLPFPSWMGVSASAWNAAWCGWRGSNPVPGANGGDFPLAEGSLGASEGAGGAIGGWRRGVWGDTALGVHSRLAPICTGISSVPPARGGSVEGTAPGHWAEHRGAAHSRLPLGWFGAAQLGSARLTYP